MPSRRAIRTRTPTHLPTFLSLVPCPLSPIPLVEDLSFESRNVGPLPMSRYLQPMAMVWIHLALTQNLQTHIAFKPLRR